MSKASRHVDWCLKKSKKEIEECKKQHKRPKHRGLLKVKPNMEESKEHIKKAERELEITEYLLKGKFTNMSVSTIFYTMYHCFLSIAAKFGYESGNQTCTIALMEHLKEEGKIDLDEKYIEYFKYEEDEDNKESIIDLREETTYGTDIKVEKSKIDGFIKDCRELIDITKEIVY